ncbi:MAG: hypothetical protein J6B81_03250 [Spirochaetaceae bacterium]|nr:hypothetical protein [Spirochaetaceae bacterium]
MIKDELFERSPIRCFDKATGGGLKAGEMGLLTAKKGLGKTSVLVQFGVDTLLQDKQIVHVSFDQQSSNVISWYQDIFTEIAKKKNINNITEQVSELVHKRIILNFNQDTVSLPQVINTVKALAQGGISTSCMVVDGIDLAKISADDLKVMADYAKEAGITIWFSATSDAEKLSDMVDSSLLAFFDIVASLQPKTDVIEIVIPKLRDSAIKVSGLKLDSKTLLIAEK